MSPLVRRRPHGTSLALGVAVALSWASLAEARPYTVVSCDAAPAASFSSEAWQPSWSLGGSAYAACPAQGDLERGISNRITGVSVPALTFSACTFTAPAGTSVSALRWGGRYARNDCRWGTFVQALPSKSVLFGLRPNAGCASTGLNLIGQPVPFAVPAGTRSLQQLIICGAGSCGPGATFHTQFAAVTVEDPTLPFAAATGALAAGRWVRGNQVISVRAHDNSGIARTWATLGSKTATSAWPCSYARSRPCGDQTGPIRVETGAVASGSHQLRVGASDAAGNFAEAGYVARVDNEPPARVRPLLDGGQAWRRTNGFTVRWTTPPQAHAPIIRARYRLCGPAGCVEGSAEGAGIEALPGLRLADVGEHTLQVWLEDEAGNHSHALSASDLVHLRLDQEAPQLSFDAQDPGDPLRVSVRADDRHSGVDTGEIEIRRRASGAWQSLATAREGQRLVSYVDDERLRAGAYELRARARDMAGNESSTDRRANGVRAAINLPARFATRLAVGLQRTVGARGRRRRVELSPQATARHRTALKLSGRLTNADGQPVGSAPIEVSSDYPGDAVGLVPTGLARTGRDGRFTYVVRATRNKVLRFRYAGSRRIRAATGDFALRVPAATSIQVRPRTLRNGQRVRLSGVVGTRPLPPAGKLIEVQAYFRRRFRTFSTTRAAPDGSWSFDYRFGGTRGRVPYRLRVLLPAEGGYPFLTGRSRVARVVVVGP